MKEKPYIVLGALAIAGGSIGLVLALLAMVGLVVVPYLQTPPMVADVAILTLTKIAMLITGVLLFVRPSAARAALIVTLLLSTSESLISLNWVLPVVHAKLTPDMEYARHIGNVIGALSIPVIYLCVLGYLMVPQSESTYTVHDWQPIR